MTGRMKLSSLKAEMPLSSQHSAAHPFQFLAHPAGLEPAPKKFAVGRKSQVKYQTK
jgi:hypothetical protein